MHTTQNPTQDDLLIEAIAAHTAVKAARAELAEARFQLAALETDYETKRDRYYLATK